jgi:hypothetical protein
MKIDLNYHIINVKKKLGSFFKNNVFKKGLIASYKRTCYKHLILIIPYIFKF